MPACRPPLPRFVVLASLLVAAAGAWPLAAGTLYRCVGADGISHFGSQRLAGKACTVAASFRPEPARPTPVATATPRSAPAEAASAAPARPRPARRIEFLATPGAAASGAVVAPRGARVTRGAVYTYVKNGITHYTNVRPRDRGVPVRTLFSYVETCYACAPLPGVDFGHVRLNTTAWAEEIRAAAAEFGVDEALVRAIVHAESSFNPNAVSHKNAQGLMQLIPATAERFGVADAFDPVQNIRGGVEYLAWLLDRFDGNVTLAAAGYNAGEGNVDRHGGVPPFEETRRYVERVAILHARYRQALDDAAAGSGPASTTDVAAP